ncbi:hypothetical protein SLAV_02265 [Streptomyces lavendulae subsp. lavendulae]|uniref:Uncharacterized protein n=1 Tax=Streptomyces lavendulae subsp. lavendulae TaxID=58340 RepID=A0A2K8P6K4_STRLA|nr:hypothetical protein [Streptomyces lavendulae]ATZ22377.1 hypothetical protein SLAV_02265 [Streptomyces lavendulae subsp. lavendulae]QUQ52221.1 hypothetical protein SLLC_00295 [Streptomyces lavendulae subsp. lavendulae]
MASLHYEILTEPTSLQVSDAGEEHQGTVYIVVSNPTMDEVIWYSIEVRVPCGQADGDLTADPKTITARVERNTATKPGEEPVVAWDDSTGVLTVTARPNALFREAGSMALVLDGFPVSGAAGLVLLSVTERAANGARVQKNPVTLSLLKRLPTVPRNFRPRESLVVAGQDVVLQWDGPDTLTYWIQGPDGSPETVTPKQGTGGWQWSPAAGREPKRDATYTLMATSPGGQQPGYFLTTTVHLRSPEFESVTATGGVHSPWVEGTTDKGRITFTTQGAQIRDAGDVLGTLSAARTDTETVTATWVRGRESDAGWIRFPSDGIRVGRGGGEDLGTVTADKLSVNGINTQWVGDRDAGKGWVEFPRSGVNVRKDGGQDWGTVAADTADLNGINTKWVQGRTAADGWIEFPPSGVNVFQGAGSRQWGTIAADKADLNDVVTQRAQVKERLTLHGGLSVDNVLETQDGPPRLIVHGRLDAEGEVQAHRTLTVNGDLSTLGILRVQGESRFNGKMNANAHLSVRNGHEWIMHTNDGKVSIQGDLRVHGAFRSDS